MTLPRSVPALPLTRRVAAAERPTARKQIAPLFPAGLAAALVFFGCLAIPLRVGAQRIATDTVTVEYRALMTPDVTQQLVRRKALEGALAEAVRRLGGIQVQSGTLFRKEERQGAVRDDFVSVVQLESRGRVVDYEVLDEEWISTRHQDIGPQVYLRLRLRAAVAHETGEPDASFRLDLALNASSLMVRSDRPAENDELIATVRSTQDAALTLVVVADDSVTVLFPNSYVSEAPIRADESQRFPADDWRNQGLRLRAALPHGLAARREVVMAVAVRGNVAPFVGSSAMDLQRWLAAIPLERRAIATAVVEVRRTP
ncbi:MAG: hypothetical protein MNPFHGCM_00889 [Gemmatimonadaceae bacterium]|nr:hypothetical protein [Gemmatimonadaceae bacterium]